MPEGVKKVGVWWVDRAREPSTYQGLSIIAGVLGSYFFGDSVVGVHALDVGLAIVGLISVGKKEAVVGRDF